MSDVLIERLADYQIDPARGFLPALDPLDQLPPGYAAWDRLSPQVSTLLMAGRLRDTLDQLPPLDVGGLESEMQLQRAMLLLSVFANAYVWAENPPATRIPRGVAMPLYRVAEMLGRPPIAAHASIVLHNWQRLDADGPIDLGNLGALQLFLGGIDEQWFYLVTVAIEARGAPALPALVDAQRAVQRDRVDDLAPHLKAIGCTLASVTQALLRMPERCDPYVFFHRVRPYLTGWPEPGIVYEGVSDEPQMCAGGSAAQSPLIQALDAGLGVRHRDEMTSPFLLDMRRYMSPPHRRFIETLEARPSVRQFVLDRSQTHPVLRDLYNDCVRALEDFRQKHIEIAVRYITRQAAKGEEAKGTGGTNFGVFLGRARKETSEHEIA